MSSNYMRVVSPTRNRGRWGNTPQGQQILPILTHLDAPWTTMSVMKIEMTPGKVTVPHDHDGVVTPLIHLMSGAPVATFIGQHLEELVWIHAGEWASIAHVPHMAVYPRLAPLLSNAEAIEVRNAPHVEMHTTPRPDLWVVARQRVEEQGWESNVTWPQAALEAFHAAGQPAPDLADIPVATPAGPDIIQQPCGG
jgi:hypothetical protein